MTRWFLSLVVALAAAGAAHAGGPVTTVDDFLTQWQSIKTAVKVPAQRSEALKEAFELSQLLASAFGRYKAVLDDDKKNGRPPRACAVKGSKLDFTLDELAGSFAALPPGQRHESIDQAYFAFLDKKLPCLNV